MPLLSPTLRGAGNTNDWCIKLVSHWHANSSRLFREFSQGTFARYATVRVLHECRENFHVSRTSRELVAKVLNMFKILCEFFSQKNRKTVARPSCDGRTTFVRVSRTCRCEILANLQCDTRTNTFAGYIFKIRPKFANLLHKCLFNEIATNDWCIKLVSHWHANSSRLFREFSRGTFARHASVRVLHECHENFHVSRTSRELVAKVLNIFKIFM